MRTEVVGLDLRLRRRTLLGTALGAAAYLLLVIAVYPSFRRDSGFDAMIAANPAAAAAFGVSGSITSPAGWLGANMYANVAPLLALLLSIGYGAAAIAGQDDDGTLGLVTSLPLSRPEVLAQKAVVLWAVSLVVPLAALVTCVAGPAFQLSPDWGHLGWVTVSTALLAFDLGAVALLVGALTGSRGVALGTASSVAMVAYLVSALAPVVPAMGTVRWLSPFTWAVGNEQLARGQTLGGMVALVGLGVLLVGVTLPAFRRLDIH
ncbi:MAG: ABC transporter permease [Actinomycetota bacterium]|nr:ABC transporter permease [Actinomycetota bacterium]